MTVQTPSTPPDPSPSGGDGAEAGVIEDARARQQRHRRSGSLAAALLVGIAALVLTSGGGGGHTGSGAHADGGASASGPATANGDSSAGAAISAAPEYVARMGLLAPRVGWVVNGAGVYVTRDGGRSWSKRSTQVSPRGASAAVIGSTSPSSSALLVSAVDPESAYARCVSASPVTSANSALTAGNAVVSMDSGRTWGSSSFPKCLTPASLSFVNGRDGFTLGHFDNYGRPTPMLYRTTDAGHTWDRVGRPPFEGSISFANTRDGLGGGWGVAQGPVDSAAIYRTADGGRSWTRTSLCQPATVYACEAPSLFRSGRGVVAVTVHNEPSSTAVSGVDVYTTRNYGVTWTRHLLPDTPNLVDSTAYVPFSAPNANDLFAWISPYLYRSTDGGVTWSRSAEPSLTGQQELSSMDFVSATYGWFNDNTFDYTTDGGRHWTAVGHIH
jgi:photosystem II stability/assembly factor-like uncharacterized protein